MNEIKEAPFKSIEPKEKTDLNDDSISPDEDKKKEVPCFIPTAKRRERFLNPKGKVSEDADHESDGDYRLSEEDEVADSKDEAEIEAEEKPDDHRKVKIKDLKKELKKEKKDCTAICNSYTTLIVSVLTGAKSAVQSAGIASKKLQKASNILDLQSSVMAETNTWLADLDAAKYKKADIIKCFKETMGVFGKDTDEMKDCTKKAAEEIDSSLQELKEIQKEAKKHERKAFSRSGAYYARNIAACASRVIGICAMLKIDSFLTPNKQLETNLMASEDFNLFWILCKDFFLKMERLLSAKAYLCLLCWTVLFIKDIEQKNFYKATPEKFKPLLDCFKTAMARLPIKAKVDHFYSKLGLTEENLNNPPKDVDYRRFPRLILPGNRKKDNQGHVCFTYDIPELDQQNDQDEQ